jgi:integrase/recombinase XerD
MKPEQDFAPLLQAYFTDRLIGQRNASPHTVASHRDTFRLLLGFAQKALKKSPTSLALADLDAPFIGSFLDQLEKDRGNTPQTRNVRLAAIHSFFNYRSLQAPSLGALAQRVLAIPGKRHKTKPVDFLTHAEIQALVAAPNQTIWSGRRDHTLLLVAVQTGLRASELIGLCCQDVVFGTGAHIRCLGKGRKERCTPLRKDALAALRRWLPERNGYPRAVQPRPAHGRGVGVASLCRRLFEKMPQRTVRDLLTLAGPARRALATGPAHYRSESGHPPDLPDPWPVEPPAQRV